MAVAFASALAAAFAVALPTKNQLREGFVVTTAADWRMQALLAEDRRCLDVAVFMRNIYVQVVTALRPGRTTSENVTRLFKEVIAKKYKKVGLQIHPDKAGPGTWPLTGCRLSPHVQGRPAPGHCCRN